MRVGCRKHVASGGGSTEHTLEYINAEISQKDKVRSFIRTREELTQFYNNKLKV